MLRRHFLMSAALVFLMDLTADAASPALLPRDIVALAYRLSLDPKSKESAYFSAAFRKRYFSKSFLAAVLATDAADAKSGDVTIDWDPITSSNDPDVHGLAIESESADAAKTTIVAKFRSHETPTLVRYDFIREGRAWKLDDIRGDADGKPWSIRALLSGK